MISCKLSIITCSSSVLVCVLNFHLKVKDSGLLTSVQAYSLNAEKPLFAATEHHVGRELGASIRDQLMHLPCPICCFQAFPAFYWKIKLKKIGIIILGVHDRFCCFCFRKRQKWQFFFMPEARCRRCPRCGSVSYECNVTLWKTVKIPKIRENPTTFSQAMTFDSAVCF